MKVEGLVKGYYIRMRTIKWVEEYYNRMKVAVGVRKGLGIIVKAIQIERG